MANVSGVALLALQKGPKTGQAGAYYGRAPLINIGAEIEDYDDTMAILDNLDLLVTVDTRSHIWPAPWGGRLGGPPRAPDWRWLLDRADTPWYPTDGCSVRRGAPMGRCRGGDRGRTGSTQLE